MNKFILKEGGAAVAGASQIPREMYEETVRGVLKKTGLDKLKYGTDIKPVGNITQPFLGDIDLSIEFDKLKELWNLPEINDDQQDKNKNAQNDFWEALEEKLKQIDPGCVVSRALKQFHVPAPILKNGKQQPEYHDGKPVEGTKAIVQVDFFVGNVTWMTDMLSGTPSDSKFKAVFRNTLLGNIISKSYIKEYTSENDPGYKEIKKYLLGKNIPKERLPNFENEKLKVSYTLDFKNGLSKKYEVVTEDGKEKRIFREIVNSQIDGMAEFVFGPGTKWSDLNSFEKLFAKFDHDPYFNKMHGDKKDLIEDETIQGLDSKQRILFVSQSKIQNFEVYKNMVAKMTSQLQMDLQKAKEELQKSQFRDKNKGTYTKTGKTGKPLASSLVVFKPTDQWNLDNLPKKIEMIEKALKEHGNISESLNEAREGIGRFKGESQFTNKDFLEVLKKLVEETDNLGKKEFEINFLENKSVDMVEKMDASFMQFGLDPKGRFFMEPNYGGPVTIETVKAKFGFKKDSFDSFMALYENKKFQNALKKIFDFYGPFKFDAEMFPTFTHDGKEEVVFASTKYRRDKFGSFGGFVVFKCWLFEKTASDWRRPEPALNEAIISKFKELSAGFEKEWKIYSNDADMRLPGKIKIDIGELASYISDEQKYNQLLEALGTTKKSELRTKFLPIITSLREQLQGALDNYANNISSKLGSKDSKVEGVVLRIKAKDGSVFEVKGTSEEFKKQAQIVWEDRLKINKIAEDFYDSVAKNVLKAAIYDPDSKSWDEGEISSEKLKKAIKKIVPKLDPKEETEEAFLKLLVPYVTKNAENTLSELDTNLEKSINSARIELKSVEENFKSEEKKSSLDVDSIRKTKDFIKNLEITLKDYEIILTNSEPPEKKFLSLLQKFVGKSIEHAMVARKPPETSEDFDKRTKVILWSGRAQPWHKGHDNMIKIGKSKLKELGADKIFIVVIRGADSSTNKVQNPLSKEEQETLINTLYANDPQVELSEVFPPNPTPQILINQIAYSKGYIVVGWLAGEDPGSENRSSAYQTFIDKYIPQAFKSNHEYSPIDFNPKTGGKKAEIITTPRLMSGTKSRESTKELAVEEWLKNVAPSGISGAAKKEYENVYNIIKQRLEEVEKNPVKEMVLSFLNETIQKRGKKFCLVSKKSKKNLGCYRSRKGAEEREKQVQYFKHVKKENSAAGVSAMGYGAPLIKKEELK